MIILFYKYQFYKIKYIAYNEWNKIIYLIKNFDNIKCNLSNNIKKKIQLNKRMEKSYKESPR
jgi:hypothetical protein